MPWQELGSVSRADISMDSDGYVHFTRTFKIWDVDRYSFFPNLDAITQVGGTATLPQYGDEVYIRLPNQSYGPFLIGAGGDGEQNSIKTAAFLHTWRMQPSTAAVFVAVAHYSNDPRLVPNGVNYHADQQQAMVSVPVVRRSTIAVGAGGLDFGYIEDSLQIPMAVESIQHTVTVPRSTLNNAEARIADRVNQLHQLPIKPPKTPCLYLGADIRMRGVQWIDVTHRWQWQSGVSRVYNQDVDLGFRFFNKSGVEFVPDVDYVDAPKRIIPANPNVFSQQRYLVPPYHEIKMMIEYETQTGGIRVPVPVWYYRMPFAAESSDIIGWKSLPGADKFIWGLTP